MTHFPRLNEARHYNGIGTLDFMPFVFGGWNNGSTSSLEYLDERSESPKWRWGFLRSFKVKIVLHNRFVTQPQERQVQSADQEREVRLHRGPLRLHAGVSQGYLENT